MGVSTLMMKLRHTLSSMSSVVGAGSSLQNQGGELKVQQDPVPHSWPSHSGWAGLSTAPRSGSPNCITEVVVFEEWRYYTAVVRIIVGTRTCKVVESSFTPRPCKRPDVLPRISMCDTHSIDISIFKCQVAVCEVYICLEST